MRRGIRKIWYGDSGARVLFYEDNGQILERISAAQVEVLFPGAVRALWTVDPGRKYRGAADPEWEQVASFLVGENTLLCDYDGNLQSWTGTIWHRVGCEHCYPDIVSL